MHEETTISHLPEAPIPSPSKLRRVSWGAILAGVAVAMSLQLLLNLVGIGIGASTIDPRQGDTPGQGLAIGAGIWFAVSALISLFAGGWAAGRLAGVPNGKDGMLHGFTMWSVTTMLTIYLLSTAVGSLIGGTASLIGGAGSLAGSGIMHSTPMLADLSKQITGLTPTEIKNQAGDVATDPRFETFAKQIITNGSATPEAQSNLADLVAQKQGIPQAQASDEVQQWQARLQQAKQQTSTLAVNTADDAAAGLSKSALWSSLALFLGLVAGTLGGLVGSVNLGFRRQAHTLRPAHVA